MINKNIFRCLLLIYSCSVALSEVLAEARFDSQAGILHIPAVNVEHVGVLAADLILTDDSQLIFDLDSYSILSHEQSRNLLKADYSFTTGELILPVTNINDERFQLTLVTLSSGPGLRFQFSEFNPVTESGEAVYAQAATDGNTFSCSSCHALSEENGFAADGMRRPAHPLQNVTKRADFKNGQLNNILDAVNSCRIEWMNASSWQNDSPQWQLLYSWLDNMKTDNNPESINFTISQAPEDMSGGDATAGEQQFNQTCAVCHGINGAGTQLAPKVVGTGITENLVGQRVRSSGLSNSDVYTGLTGGIMPFWSADRLSDTELKNIAAYIAQSEQDNVDDADSDIVVDSGCSKQSDKIGMVAELSGFAHDVSGTARIIDDCTIVIENFNFDGGGIVVEIYAGNNNNYDEGFSLTGDIVGQAYVNDTFVITLPSFISLNQFDGISVWCVGVGVSFGDGQFQ